MECKAITNNKTQCSRTAENNSKYCWQHRNYDLKENISTQYFQNVPLLQNTLLTYFSTAEELKNINKQFQTLEYDKYITPSQPHGVKVNYYPNSQLKERINYKNGKKDGLYERYYINGQLHYRINYKNGKLNGLYEVWYKNILREKSNYLNGELNGEYDAWWTNGELSDRKNYKNGKRDGISESWYDNGELWIKSNYIDGELDGLYEEWDLDGTKHEAYYKNGKEIRNKKY
jgi:antitoxin component YwqK of YwqJK toxin-antitoxin module